MDALDGMDGRNQVMVIGATYRPDAVNPALRRPGRFDTREFYFGLPGLDARERILSIMTKKWEGWGAGDEDNQAEVKERLGQVNQRLWRCWFTGIFQFFFAMLMTFLLCEKAVCTEAAPNAIQKPETIGVGLRDFMISIKSKVPLFDT
jgi:ATPase family AAA domain-containing protein 2